MININIMEICNLNAGNKKGATKPKATINP
jgi:hypothetical protein